MFIQRLAPVYAHVIADGCEEGVFDTDCPLESAELLLAGIQFITDTGVHCWGSKQITRRLLAMPRLIENQLGAKRGTFDFLISG